MIRAYKQDTQPFFEGLKSGGANAGFKIPTFIPELFPSYLETERRPETNDHLPPEFKFIYRFITDEKFIYEGPIGDNLGDNLILEFLSKASAIRKEFNHLLAGRQFRESIHIMERCPCLILKESVRSRWGIRRPVRPLDFFPNVDDILGDYFSIQTGPVSTAILLSTLIYNRIVVQEKISHVTLPEIAGLLEIKTRSTEDFKFRSFDSNQVETIQKIIKMVLSRYFPNFSQLAFAEEREKVTILANLIWDFDEELHNLIETVDQKILENCCGRLVNGKINSPAGLQACLNPKKPERKQKSERYEINAENKKPAKGKNSKEEAQSDGEKISQAGEESKSTPEGELEIKPEQEIFPIEEEETLEKGVEKKQKTPKVKKKKPKLINM